ncbi:hypothetical protein FHG87_017859 [Trinorchestia longiramus]|nr:hypothetical protein FHG87_017859 [Trinorchestia longiramus]
MHGKQRGNVCTHPDMEDSNRDSGLNVRLRQLNRSSEGSYDPRWSKMVLKHHVLPPRSHHHLSTNWKGSSTTAVWLQKLHPTTPVMSSIWKRNTKPELKKIHKKRREEWVREKVKWNADNWAKVVFSDEKKFNLDGPDSFQYYWYDLRKEEHIFSRRPFGGGSQMIWGAFSAEGKASLVQMEGKQNSVKYTEVLQKSHTIFR